MPSALDARAGVGQEAIAVVQCASLPCAEPEAERVDIADGLESDPLGAPRVGRRKARGDRMVCPRRDSLSSGRVRVLLRRAQVEDVGRQVIALSRVLLRLDPELLHRTVDRVGGGGGWRRGEGGGYRDNSPCGVRGDDARLGADRDGVAKPVVGERRLRRRQREDGARRHRRDRPR
eukprot:525112-Rhodomonas_salina.4